MARTFLPLSLLLAAAATPVAAQSPSVADALASPASQGLPALDAPLFDEPGDGRIWVLGTDYKASIGPDGLTFVPFLGSDAPRNEPVQFTLADVRLGGEALALETPGLARRGNRVDLDHGRVRESFDVRLDGVEQSFTFDALPARGRLELTLAVTTGLRGADGPDGIDFVGERGGVVYGRAVALDAAGRRLDLATMLDGDRIVIDVPESFVATAALPLVVDPLIGTSTTFTESNYVWSNDATWDESVGQYVLVYTRKYSDTDHDVFVRRFDATLQPIGGALTVDFTSTMWANSCIGGLEYGDMALVVADHGNQGDGIVGRILTLAPSVTISSTINIAVTGMAGIRAGQHLYPDVAGRMTTSAMPSWVVVWMYYQNGHSEIESRTVWHDSTLSPQVPRLSDPTTDVNAPKISRHGGNESWNDRFAVVFSRLGTGSAIFDSMRRVILDVNGAVVSPDTWLAGPPSSPVYAVSPATDGPIGQRRMLVTYSAFSVQTASEDVFGVLIDDNGNLLEGAQNFTLLESSSSAFLARPQYPTAVDTDGCRYAVTYSDSYPHVDNDVRVLTLGHTPWVLPTHWTLYDRVSLALSLDYERASFVIAPRRTSAHQRALVGWSRDAATQQTVLALYDMMANVGGIASRATGCGGLTAIGSGTPALGATFDVAVTNATGIAGLLVGIPTSAPIPGCNGCTLGTTGFTTLPATAHFTVPCNLALVGGTLSFQGYDSGNPACLGLVRLSNTVDVTVR